MKKEEDNMQNHTQITLIQRWERDHYRLGNSNRLGSVILAEIRNINTFNHSAQLQAFAGLEPAIYQSGQLDAQGKWSNEAHHTYVGHSYKLPLK